MIDFNENFKTYTCPYCGCKQSFEHSYDKMSANNAYNDKFGGTISNEDACLDLYVIRCINDDCQEVTILAWNSFTRKQYDISPRVDCERFPTYIPLQIRTDYEEGCAIIQESPKAAATLFRRCLQGMIHDFWDVKEKNLNAEISSLKGKIPDKQWQALDALRKIGNIGAHMEADVNIIIDIDQDEATKLQKMIELLLKQWYVDRHEEERLYAEIVETAETKEDLGKNEK